MRRFHHRGGVLKSLFLIFLAVVWIGGGVHGLWEMFWERNPAEMTLAQYVKDPPTQNHVKLSGCEVALLDAVYQQDKLGRVTAVMVPVREPGTEGPGVLVVKTEIYNGLMESVLAAGKDKAKIEAIIQKNANVMTETREFQGRLTKDTYKIRDKFSAKEVKAGYLMLEHGKDSEWGFFLFSIGLGVLALVGGIKGWE